MLHFVLELKFHNTSRLPIEFDRSVKPEIGAAGLNYAHLRNALQRSSEIYTTYAGLKFLLNKRAEAINRIMSSSASSKVKALFSSGYPNYMIPEIDQPNPETSLPEDAFEPIPEVRRYVKNTMDRGEAFGDEAHWPCPDCYQALNLHALRPEGHQCESPISPFFLYSTIPDIDLYIVVGDYADVSEIIQAYKDQKLNIAEEQMIDSIINFPEIINLDPHFVKREDF